MGADPLPVKDYRWADPYQVDIIVRGWGNLDLTRRLFASITRYTDASTYRLIYVDNGSEMMHFADLAADYPGCAYVRLPFNHGSVRAINLGLSIALRSPAPYILLMDNDTEIPAGDVFWLDRWLKYMELDVEGKTVGSAGAVTDYVSLLQQAERVPDRFARDWKDGRLAGRKAPMPLPLLVSFAVMLNKAAVQAVGDFDERFEPGNGEDFDYSIRLAQAGYANIIAESVWVHHKGSQTFRRLDFPALLAQSTNRLIEKYGEDGLRQVGINVRRAL